MLPASSLPSQVVIRPFKPILKSLSVAPTASVRHEAAFRTKDAQADAAFQLGKGESELLVRGGQASWPESQAENDE